jgi:hypothetical protein
VIPSAASCQLREVIVGQIPPCSIRKRMEPESGSDLLFWVGPCPLFVWSDQHGLRELERGADTPPGSPTPPESENAFWNLLFSRTVYRRELGVLLVFRVWSHRESHLQEIVETPALSFSGDGSGSFSVGSVSVLFSISSVIFASSSFPSNPVAE